MTGLIPARSAFVARKTPFNLCKRTSEYNSAADASWPLVRVQTQCSVLIDHSIKDAQT
jgi:hypothetical protein